MYLPIIIITIILLILIFGNCFWSPLNYIVQIKNRENFLMSPHLRFIFSLQSYAHKHFLGSTWWPKATFVWKVGQVEAACF